MLGPLELGLQVLVSHHMGLGTELRFSGGVARALSCPAITAAQLLSFSFVLFHLFFLFFSWAIYTYTMYLSQTHTHTLTNSHRHASTRLPPSNLLSFFCIIICESNFNQAQHELAMTVLTFDTSSWETEIDASKIQSHPFQRRNSRPSWAA